MGVGGSKKKKPKTKDDQKVDKDIAKVSTKIDNAMFKDHLEDRRVIKLLLLGAGESGKSTLFKQTIKLYGKGFDKASMDGYLQIIYRNILSGMSVLVKQSDQLGGPCTSQDDVKTSKQFFSDMQPTEVSDGKVDAEVAKHVKALWGDRGIKETFAQRAKFQIPDSAAYFFENVDRIATADYSPNYDDVLRCRSRTTGIVETCFQIKNDYFKIMDVGGQRSERKKWIHCFEDVTAVIFVAAINEYNQTLYEDNSTNRIMEALELFDKTCNSKWFDNAAIILFLNKCDLFAEKIQTIDLKCCFPEYAGGLDYKNASDFLLQKFTSMNKQPKLKIYGHITCATNTDNVQLTFNSVKKIVISASLKKSGLA